MAGGPATIEIQTKAAAANLAAGSKGVMSSLRTEARDIQKILKDAARTGGTVKAEVVQRYNEIQELQQSLKEAKHETHQLHRLEKDFHFLEKLQRAKSVQNVLTGNGDAFDYVQTGMLAKKFLGKTQIGKSLLSKLPVDAASFGSILARAAGPAALLYGAYEGAKFIGESYKESVKNEKSLNELEQHIRENNPENLILLNQAKSKQASHWWGALFNPNAEKLKEDIQEELKTENEAYNKFWKNSDSFVENSEFGERFVKQFQGAVSNKLKKGVALTDQQLEELKKQVFENNLRVLPEDQKKNILDSIARAEEAKGKKPKEISQAQLFQKYEVEREQEVLFQLRRHPVHGNYGD